MEAIKNMTELNEVLSASSGLVILKFGADWCNPCRMLGHVLNDMERKYDDVKFLKCDADIADPELLNEFKVRSIPLLVFFKDGFTIDRVVGSISNGALSSRIKENRQK